MELTPNLRRYLDLKSEMITVKRAIESDLAHIVSKYMDWELKDMDYNIFTTPDTYLEVRWKCDPKCSRYVFSFRVDSDSIIPILNYREQF